MGSDDGATLAISVAPLTLQGLTDVSYNLRVANGLGEAVWERLDVRASAFGDGTGLTYVGPCDADPAAQPNRIELTVAALFDAGGMLAADEWSDPTAGGPLTLQAACVANSDTPVTFNVTVMRPARQGFFDVAVEFDDIFCSAKFDCEDTSGQPIPMIFGTDGARLPSAIMALACTGGPGADTWLYLNDVALTCDGQTAVIPVDGGPGNVFSFNPATAPAPIIQAAVYRGVEQLTGVGGVDLAKRYVNVAMALDFAAITGACTLRGAATAHDGPLDLGTTPGGAYPVIRYEIPLVGASGAAYVCGQMAMDDPAGTPGDRVATEYTALSVPEQFDVGYGMVDGTFSAQRTGCRTGDVPPDDICLGVCALQPPECVLGQWICDGPGYEAVETSCDGFDNDCDGMVDEDVCVSCQGEECTTCTPDLATARGYLGAMADIDFDFDCNVYLTTLISGPDSTVRITPDGQVSRWYGNANQNMTFALVDPDPNNRRVIVTYSCCPTCGCTAKNGVTLLYTCAPGDPGCGCAGQSQCPGFLDQAFITTGALATSVSGIVAPTGLAAGPGNHYFVGNFRSDMCTGSTGCVACDGTDPDIWCTPSGTACCAPSTLGRLVEFVPPTQGLVAKWQLAYDFAPEQVIGLASARDGSVLVGTYKTGGGSLYRFDPISRSVTLLDSHPSYVFSVTQDRQTGDIYAELGAGSPKLLRYLEDGTAAALPSGVPGSPAGRGALQYGPDGRLYRLRFTGGPLDAYDLTLP